MKIINSPVRGIDLDRFISCRSKGATVAAAKKMTHKQERARLSQVTRRELDQEHLLQLEEQTEKARLARESYKNLMRKVMSNRPPRRRKTSSARPIDRIEVVIESCTGDRLFSVLASCAMAD